MTSPVVAAAVAAAAAAAPSSSLQPGYPGVRLGCGMHMYGFPERFRLTLATGTAGDDDDDDDGHGDADAASPHPLSLSPSLSLHTPHKKNRSFYQSTDLTLWFSSWKTSGPASYAVALLGLFLLAAAQEGLAAARAALAGVGQQHASLPPLRLLPRAPSPPPPSPRPPPPPQLPGEAQQERGWSPVQGLAPAWSFAIFSCFFFCSSVFP